MPTTDETEPRCPECASAVTADQRFCSQCGAKLQQRAPETHDRRLLTVVGCTFILPTESDTGDGVPNRPAQLLDLARAEIGRFGGVVLDRSPGAFLSLFGAPIPHEDHARRAALAALALRDAVPTDGGTPGFGLGIATGEAIVTLAGERVVAIVGRPADDACDLAAHAANGTILLDAATEELVSGYIECSPIDMEREGAPCAVFVAKRQGSRVSRLDRPDRQLTPFTGRQRQLTTLGELLDETIAGRGQVVGIAAEAGMGKSRLVAEFLVRNRGRIRTREGRCLSYAGGTPLVPIADLVRAQLALDAGNAPSITLDAVRRRLAALDLEPSPHAAYLGNVIGVRDAADALRDRSPEAVRDGTFDSLVALFVAEAAEAPTVLIVEDLHWVDPVSQDVLARLVANLPGRRALILCTYRPGYQAPWMGVAYATQMTLPPLRRLIPK